MVVIFSGPQQHAGPGTRYIAWDGTVTDLRGRAAKFANHDEAKEFAKAKGILLTATRYIGQDSFEEHELR